MSKTFEHPVHGKVEIRNAMLEDDNGIDLHEGFEIKFLEDNIPIIEGYGYIDLSDISLEGVTQLIDEYEVINGKL